MDIGKKLQMARMKTNLTQEQVAEVLGVSRQTISNWENEKNYPDIRSVITLSDLYHVSLDELLKEKEETSMSNYVEYLEESTNTVRSRNKWSRFILIITYFIIWALSLIIYWFFTSGSDAMGYSLIFLWMLLPITTFVVSLIIGINDYWEKWKWFVAPILGGMYMLVEYATFECAAMIAFEKIKAPNWSMALIGTVISAIGLGIGVAICRMKRK